MRISAWCLAALTLFSAWACQGGRVSDGVPDTRTNWLSSCLTNADCSSALSCSCGTCTVACSTDADCTRLDPASECTEPTDCASATRVCAAASSTGAAGGSSSMSSGNGPTGGEANGNAGGSAGSAAGGTTSTAGGSTATAGDGGSNPASAGGGGMTSEPSQGGATTTSMDAGAPPAQGTRVALGEYCYDNSISEEVLECAEGFCAPETICLDGQPSLCTRSCACTPEGQQCRTVTNGEVTSDRPCCAGSTCELTGGSSSGGVDVYYCQPEAAATCESTCELTVQEETCWSDPEETVIWLCMDDVPPEVVAGCSDMATGLPRWCCSPSILPECLP